MAFALLIVALSNALSAEASSVPTLRYARGYVRSGNSMPLPVANITAKDRRDAPDAIDWSTRGATTLVKNQGDCGSCWAFSTVEGIESAVFMATGKLPEKLSTQQIISCDKKDDGCDGGDPRTALKYVMSAGGLDTDSSYPDTSHETGHTGKCHWDENKYVKVTSFKYAVEPCDDDSACDFQDEDGLAAAVAKYGPLSICVNAHNWDDYDGGIFRKNCPHKTSALDHCVQLVGYDRSASTPYWKVRNSWGKSWGEEGHIRLPYGENACGLADEAYIISASLEASTNLVV